MSGGELSVITEDVLAAPSDESGQWTLVGEQKLTCQGCSIGMAGAEREPFADVFFRQVISRCVINHLLVQRFYKTPCSLLVPLFKRALPFTLRLCRGVGRPYPGFRLLLQALPVSSPVAWIGPACVQLPSLLAFMGRACPPCSILGKDAPDLLRRAFNLCSNSGATHTTVQLNMDQVDFGVRNSCTQHCSARNQSCDQNCRTVFIYKTTIRVQPKPWARDCHRLQLRPHHTPQMFGLQRNVNLGIQMPLLSPRVAAINYQVGNTISGAAPEFGWNPASRDDASKSVSWTWELNRYANGLKLEFGKLRLGSRPPLAVKPHYTPNHPGTFLAQASWDIQPIAELRQEHREWDVKVSLHTAVLQSIGRLPIYSLTVGPIFTFEKLLAFSQH